MRQPLAHPGNRRPSGVVREGSLGTETRPVRADPGCRSPSLFLRRRVWAQGLEPQQCMSPDRREWGSAHAAKDANLFASSSPSRRAQVSNDRRPGQGRWPATSAQSVTKISSSDSRDPLAPVRAGELDDWRGRPIKSSGRMPSQPAECQRTGCTGPTIVEAERDSQQPAAGTRRNDLTSPSCD